MKGKKWYNLKNRTVKESLFEFIPTKPRSTFRLTPGYHGGSPPPFDTYLDFVSLDHLYFILPKYLPKFL